MASEASIWISHLHQPLPHNIPVFSSHLSTILVLQRSSKGRACGRFSWCCQKSAHFRFSRDLGHFSAPDTKIGQFLVTGWILVRKGTPFVVNPQEMCTRGRFSSDFSVFLAPWQNRRKICLFPKNEIGLFQNRPENRKNVKNAVFSETRKSGQKTPSVSRDFRTKNFVDIRSAIFVIFAFFDIFQKAF